MRNNIVRKHVPASLNIAVTFSPLHHIEKSSLFDFCCSNPPENIIQKYWIQYFLFLQILFCKEIDIFFYEIEIFTGYKSMNIFYPWQCIYFASLKLYPFLWIIDQFHNIFFYLFNWIWIYHPSKINLSLVFFTTFFPLGGQKRNWLPRRGQKSALLDPLMEKFFYDFKI